MFILILILLLLLAMLAVLLTAWSLWFQSYLYTEPGTGLVWRGPTAAAAVMALLLIWVVVAYRSAAADPEGQGHYRPLWEFSSSEAQKPFDELRVPGRDGEDVYRRRRGTGGRLEYLNSQTNRPLPSRPPKVIVMEGDKRTVFEPERDEKGNFKQRGSEALRYVDTQDKRRYMTEDHLGQFSSFRSSWLVGNLLLNFVLLADCFLVWWLLLRFSWPHALLQAVVLWLVLLLFVVPPVLSRVENVARERAAAAAAAT